MRWLRAVLCPVALAVSALGQAPTMIKVDPPNWWVNMPKPMLLIQGDHLTGATFRLNTAAHNTQLRIDRTTVSANGHWAELWLSASPTRPEDIAITATNSAGKASLPFRFAPRRPATDGFAGFSNKDTIYLIMTDRFADGNTRNDDPATERAKPRGWHGGDLRGIIDHLDYLQTLGITTVWITPVYQNHEPQSYHGYGATDLYAVDEHFGTLEDLKTLSDALHRRGMKLVLDMVPNHIGPAHPWVTDEPEPTWFHGNEAHHMPAVGEFKPLTDPHAPWRDQRDIVQGWFANILPDMNQENPDAAQYLIQNTLWWTEISGLDGIRFDTFPYVGRPFWTSLHQQLFSLYPHVTDVGEVFNGDPIIVSSFAAGVTRTGVDTGLYTPFDFPTFFGLRDVFAKGMPMTRLDDLWVQDSLYPHPERLVPFLGNHDTPRFMSLPGANERQMQLAFTVLFTMRGTPQLYSGDEIAMQGGEDPDNRHDFPGGFPGDPQSAFNSATRTPAQSAMHDWVQSLLRLRREHPALTGGSEQVLLAKGNQLAFVRTAGTEKLLIAINNSDAASTVEIPLENTVLQGAASASVIFGQAAAKLGNNTATLNLPARAAVVFSLQ